MSLLIPVNLSDVTGSLELAIVIFYCMIAIMNQDVNSENAQAHEYKRLSVEQWLDDNLRRDAFGNEAVSDRTLVNLIIEKGAKAIREILKAPQWYRKKPNTK